MNQNNNGEDMVAGASNLLSRLNDKGLQNDVQRVNEIDPMTDLKISLVSFFKDRIATVSQSELFKTEIMTALRQDLNGGTLTFDQKMSLLSKICNESNSASDSLISMFRPAPGTPSIFQDVTRKEGESDQMTKLFQSLKPEQLQKVEQAFLFLQSIAATDGGVPQDLEEAVKEASAQRETPIPEVDGDPLEEPIVEPHE